MAEAGFILTALPRKLGGVIGKIPEWFFSRPTQLMLDTSVAALACFSAYLLRFDFDIRAAFAWNMVTWIAFVAVFRPITLLCFKGYDSTWRFFQIRDAVHLILLALPLSAVIGAVRLVAPGSYDLKAMPYSVIVLEFGCFIMFASGLRTLRRITYEAGLPASRHVPTLLVGDDSSLASAIRHVELYGNVKLVGLVSEEASLLGLRVGGVPVLGSPQSLPRLMASLGIELVIVAGAELPGIGDIVEKASQFGVQVQILPSARDLVEGSVRVSRTVGISEITPKRSETHSEPHAKLVGCFRGRTALVTGAGGSIGSEIARQLAKLPIAKLIILDHDENSIFELNSELKGVCKELVPFVGDIRDKATLRLAFSEHHPEIVLHAAAYKHVPMMETNCCEAVLNNVLGTRQLADAAIEFGCERFVLISTDKAVRPSSVMGATKRVAEILVQQHAVYSSGNNTSFACVRFGNVLGSRGSVVPIFLRQIAAGGPVTITHEEMTRYFMTIPQAVQLVLQAATLASSGDVYMLDMGNPVRIIDFAKELIQLSGLRPGKDIAIKVVGIRRGRNCTSSSGLTTLMSRLPSFLTSFALRLGRFRRTTTTI